MQHALLLELVGVIAAVRYAIIFPLAVLEGPVVAVAAGALAASHILDPVIAFFVLLAADLTGDALYYALGRFGHARFLGALAGRLGLSRERTDSVARAFRDHGGKLLLFGKTQAFGSLILYACGAARMPIARYIGWNLLGSVPKVLLFMLIGYYFANALLRASRIIDAVAIAAFLGGVLLVGLYIVLGRSAGRELEAAVQKES